MPSSSLPTTPATPTSQLPSFPPHPLTGNVLGSSGSLGAVGSIGSGLSSQAIQKPLSQLGQLPLSTPASSSSGLHSPSFSSSQNPLLQQLHQAGSLGQPMGGAAMDNARLLAGLGIQKQLGGSSLLQQQQQQSALLSQSRNQAEKLRTGNFDYHSLCIQWENFGRLPKVGTGQRDRSSWKIAYWCFLKISKFWQMASILAYVSGITPSTVSGRYYHNVRLNKLSLCNSDTRCTITIIFDSGFNGSRKIIL